MKIYIGCDVRELQAADVCTRSIRRFNKDIEIEELHFSSVKDYERPYSVRGSQYIDGPTGQPFSTEFAFTRFMVPYLNDYQGWALFCDCDFLFRADPMEIMEFADPESAVMVVQHDFTPKTNIKMDGCVQKPYFRKLWSAFTLWNCAHPSIRKLGPKEVNNKDGLWLHQFRWLDDDKIGVLPEEWHWVLGRNGPISPTTHYRVSTDIKAYHYTEGVPIMPGFENCYKATEWQGYL